MQQEEQYDKLLDNLFSKLPNLSAEKADFQIPRSDVMVQGSKTLLRNISALADRARRKPDEIARYISKELAVPANIEEQGLVLNGKFGQDDVERIVKRYFETYVICKECHKPDTHLEQAEKGMYLACEACGARYWVKNY